MDIAGNLSYGSTPYEISIDATAPEAATISLDPSQNTGSDPSINITNVAAPRFSGTAEMHARIEVFWDNWEAASSPNLVSLGTTIADVNGQWSLTASGAIPDGIHQIFSSVTDEVDRSSGTTFAFYLTTDTTAIAPANLDLEAVSDAGVSDSDDITNLDAGLAISGDAEAGSNVTLTSDLDGVIGTVTSPTGPFTPVNTFPFPFTSFISQQIR